MAQTILSDEFHLSVRAPRGLLEAEYPAMRRAPDQPGFQAGLVRAVRDVVRRHPSLDKVRFALARSRPVVPDYAARILTLPGRGAGGGTSEFRGVIPAEIAHYLAGTVQVSVCRLRTGYSRSS